jgi:hypothetical protein
MAHRPHKKVVNGPSTTLGRGGDRGQAGRGGGGRPGLRIHFCLGTLTTDYREFSPVNIEIQP